MTVIVDMDIGNLGSLRNMLRRVGADADISSDPDVVARADRVILPGVGAFDAAMKTLRSTGLAEALDEAALSRGVPVLGVCLGMQLMARGSEEGVEPGLGWLDADVKRFDLDPALGLRVPHIGWNTVAARGGAALFAGMDAEPRFYFVHSYHVVCDRDEDVMGVTDYGGAFAASVGRGNMAATQFHPEKSHRFGAAVLANFLERF